MLIVSLSHFCEHRNGYDCWGLYSDRLCDFRFLPRRNGRRAMWYDASRRSKDALREFLADQSFADGWMSGSCSDRRSIREPDSSEEESRS